MSLIRAVRLKKNDGKIVETMEDLILRVDIYIDGFEPIRSIPIELGGCWSYELIPNDQNRVKGLVIKDLKGWRSKQILSIIINVKPIGNWKIVTIESPLIFSNNTQFELDFLLSDESNSPPKLINHVKKNDMNTFKILPNSIYWIPLNWLVENKSLMYLTNDNERKEYRPIFNELWKKVFGPHKIDENEKPVFEFENGIYFLSWEHKSDYHVSADLTVFKCKPTALNRPP